MSISTAAMDDERESRQTFQTIMFEMDTWIDAALRRGARMPAGWCLPQCVELCTCVFTPIQDRASSCKKREIRDCRNQRLPPSPTHGGKKREKWQLPENNNSKVDCARATHNTSAFQSLQFSAPNELTATLLQNFQKIYEGANSYNH